jgi:hypothetical protein
MTIKTRKLYQLMPKLKMKAKLLDNFKVSLKNNWQKEKKEFLKKKY